MTSKINGKTETLTTCRAEIPTNIEIKIGLDDYVIDRYYLVNFCENRKRSNEVCTSYY